MPKCGFEKFAEKFVNLLHIFRRAFLKNTSGHCFYSLNSSSASLASLKSIVHWLVNKKMFLERLKEVSNKVI